MILGITGGIASGKSTVLTELANMGIPTVSADVLAKDLLSPQSGLSYRVIAQFGEQITSAPGVIDRNALAALIFASWDARKQLEAVTHPAIMDTLRRWISEQRENAAPLAAAEIPLLFEAGMERDVDAVLAVVCDEATQCVRLMHRVPDLSTDDALSRIRVQWPIEQKAARADFVISSQQTLESMLRDTHTLVDRLKDKDR